MNEEARQHPEELPENAPKKDEKNGGFELYQLLRDMVYTLVAVTIVFVFIIRMVSVDGSSMYPTLHDRDYLVLLDEEDTTATIWPCSAAPSAATRSRGTLW